MNDLTKKVLIFGVFISIWWACTTASMNLATFVYQKSGKKDLGPFQWMFYFSTVLLSTCFYSSIKLRIKAQGLLAALLNCLFFTCQFLAIHSDDTSSHIFVAVGGILGGLGNMLINVVMGRYLSELCEREQQQQKGHYFGLFNTIYLLSCFSSGILELLMGNQSQHDLIFGIIIIISFLNLILGFFAIQNNSTEQSSASHRNSCCSQFFDLLSFYPIMKNTVFLVILDGISIGVQSSTLLRILPSKQPSFITSLSLLGWGLGAFLSGYFATRITDFIQYKICGIIEVGIFLTACLTSFIASEYRLMWMAFFAIFFWGFFSFSVEGFMNIMCCKAYKSITEAFVINRQVRCISETLYSTLNTVTNNTIPVSMLMVGISVFCIPAFFWLLFWNLEEEQMDLMSGND